MAFEDITALSGGWDGFELVGVQREGGPQIVLRLQRVPGAERGAVGAESSSARFMRRRSAGCATCRFWMRPRG